MPVGDPANGEDRCLVGVTLKSGPWVRSPVTKEARHPVALTSHPEFVERCLDWLPSCRPVRAMGEGSLREDDIEGGIGKAIRKLVSQILDRAQELHNLPSCNG